MVIFFEYLTNSTVTDSKIGIVISDINNFEKISSDKNIHTVQLINVSGSAVYTQRGKISTYMEINTNYLPVGVYILRLHQDHSIICRKIIIL